MTHAIDNISVFHVLVTRKSLWPNLLSFGTLMSSNAEKTEKTHFRTIESLQCLIWTFWFLMDITIGTPCKFWMKSNVEINLFQKKTQKGERKRRKWIHQILQKSSKLKKLSKIQSQQWAMWIKQKLQNTQRERGRQTETGYDITNMDNTL